MIKTIAVILCCIFLTSCGTKTVNWNDWDNSVIRLLIKSGNSISTGTAFSINDEGYYITNHHVIEGAISGQNPLLAIESLQPEKLHRAKIIWHSEAQDLAMVHVPTWINPPLTLADGDKLLKGQNVSTIGFPGGSDLSQSADGFTEPKIKRGIVSAHQTFSLKKTPPKGALVKMIEHDSTINSGNSGGPLADECGRIVGINDLRALTQVTAADLQRGSINLIEGTFFSISSSELITLLDQQNVNYDYASNKCISAAAAAMGKDNMIIATIVLLTGTIGIAFFFFYRKLKKSNTSNIPISRIVSRMVRQKLASNKHKQDETDQVKTNSNLQKQPQQQDKPYFDQKRGRVVSSVKQTEQMKTQDQSISYRLVSQTDQLSDLSFSKAGTYLVGRSSSRDFVITNDYISGRHLQIIINPNGEMTIEDLGSSNGTEIDGRTISPQQIVSLTVGQTLQLGGYYGAKYKLQQ